MEERRFYEKDKGLHIHASFYSYADRWLFSGCAPYGYKLVDGKLEINEEEAEAIRIIFEQCVNTDIGANGIAKYLENHGIRKITRQNG